MKRAATALALVLMASPAAAALLRAQGTLTDAAGQPVDGMARLDFRIVDAATRVEVWSEAREVEAIRGVFAVTLGVQEALPDPAAVKPDWRLTARASMGTGWTVGPLSAAGEEDRRVHLSRLLARMGAEPRASVAYLAPEYRHLFAALPAAHLPPDTISLAPACAEDTLLDESCPKAMKKVLSREERRIRDRLRRLPLEQRPRPPVPAGLASR